MILFSFFLFGCTFAAFNDTCNAPEVANYCEGICQTAFTDCALQCAQDPVCSSACIRELDICTDDCPCHNKCLAGCPCTGFACPEQILILNSFNTETSIQISTFQPIMSSEVEHLKNQHKTMGSCSVVYQNQMWLIGGDFNPRRVSIIRECNILVVSDSRESPQMQYHSCAVSTERDQIVMCGSMQEPNDCWSIDKTRMFNQIESTNSSHSFGSMVEYKDEILMIGGFALRQGATNVVENYSSGTWDTHSNLPVGLGKDGLDSHSALVIDNNIHVFGGNLMGPSTTHFVYNGNRWSSGTPIHIARSGHRSILVENFVYHIGGKGSTYVERWTKDFSEEESTTVFLEDVNTYPELFTVPYEYFQHC